MTPNHQLRRVAAVGLLGIAVIAAGCGNDDTDTASSGSTKTTMAPATTGGDMMSDPSGPACSAVEPQALAALIAMVGAKRISHGSAKAVLVTLAAEGGDPQTIVEREGLAQISDASELDGIVGAAVEANPEAAEEVRSGNQKAIGVIVGAVMRETKGRADGGDVNRLIREKLGV